LPRTRKHYRSPVTEELIGARLRQLRQQRGLTQLEVAEQLGVKQALISQYERGSVRLHGALIAGLAKILKASADDLLGLKPVPKNGHATDRRFLRRLEKIEQLSLQDKRSLLKNLDMFLKGAGVA
jgi:transcriptional regulator with XRE-family HTH domain